MFTCIKKAIRQRHIQTTIDARQTNMPPWDRQTETKREREHADERTNKPSKTEKNRQIGKMNKRQDKTDTTVLDVPETRGRLDRQTKEQEDQ